MAEIPQAALSAALRVHWETGHSRDEQALTLLAERVPGLTADRYAEADGRAAILNGAA